MPSQSSVDNKKENKDFDVDSDDEKEKTKAPMFSRMMLGKKTKVLMFICQALYLWGINRENERNEDKISFLERIGKIFLVYTLNLQGYRIVS